MNWKKTIIITLDVIIGVYLLMVMTAFIKPDETENICTEVCITIDQDAAEGFLHEKDIRMMIRREGLSMAGLHMQDINTRKVEEILQQNELIDQAQCYKTIDGTVHINIWQRVPVIRVMADNSEDYYVDTKGKPITHNSYSCHLIVATGHISKTYASTVLTPIANSIRADQFWKNQIVQLNVLDDGSLEMIPRVGDHIVYLGQPTDIEKKLERLRKFYRYGLNEAGWNRYSRISVEFDNQIICKRKN